MTTSPALSFRSPINRFPWSPSCVRQLDAKQKKACVVTACVLVAGTFR